MARWQIVLLWALACLSAIGVVASGAWLFFRATAQDCTTYRFQGEVVSDICEPVDWKVIALSSAGLGLAVLALAGSLLTLVLLRRQSAARA